MTPLKPFHWVFAILFLTIGLIWLAAISMRIAIYHPQEAVETTITHIPQNISSATHEMKSVLSQFPVEIALPQEQLLVHQKARTAILLSWGLLLFELCCAIAYLLSGLAILRGYGFKQLLTRLALTFDLILKLSVIGYQRNFSPILDYAFSQKDLLLRYYVPNNDVLSNVSGFLTGIQITQPDFHFYFIFYLIFLLAAVKFSQQLMPTKKSLK